MDQPLNTGVVKIIKQQGWIVKDRNYDSLPNEFEENVARKEGCIKG